MKNYKESSKKSYHEYQEEREDKKGFSRSDLPRKKRESLTRDDEPMISMAKSESFKNRSYDDEERKSYPPRKPGEFKKPYQKEGYEKKTFVPREGSQRPSSNPNSTGYKKPYDPNRSYDQKKSFDKPYKKGNENR